MVVQKKERSFRMVDPETYADGYIHATNYGHYVVTREGLAARNWQELEKEARQEVSSQAWSQQWDYSSYLYPLSRELAQKADFPPRPSELDHYNQLSRQFDIRPLAYDEQGRLAVKIYAITEEEQREALEIMKGMPDISPQSVVEQDTVFGFSGSLDEELPWTIRLQDYLDRQQRTQDPPGFDFSF
jgi:hypothetical protein